MSDVSMNCPHDKRNLEPLKALAANFGKDNLRRNYAAQTGRGAATIILALLVSWAAIDSGPDQVGEALARANLSQLDI